MAKRSTAEGFACCSGRGLAATYREVSASCLPMGLASWATALPFSECLPRKWRVFIQYSWEYRRFLWEAAQIPAL